MFVWLLQASTFFIVNSTQDRLSKQFCLLITRRKIKFHYITVLQHNILSDGIKFVACHIFLAANSSFQHTFSARSKTNECLPLSPVIPRLRSEEENNDVTSEDNFCIYITVLIMNYLHQIHKINVEFVGLVCVPIRWLHLREQFNGFGLNLV
jgi:hypothetical protein